MDNTQQMQRWLRNFTYEWWKSFILGSAARLNLFEHLKNPKKVDDLAEETRYSARALRIILDALTAMGILDKKDLSYCMTKSVIPFLGRNDLFSYEGYLQHGLDLSQRWTTLPEVIKTGKPDIEDKDPEFFVPLTRSLLAVNWQESQELYNILKDNHPVNILDIGGGACPWSIPFAKNNEEARLTVIDLPPVIAGSTQPILTEMGIIEKSNLMSGSFWELSWGSGYDLIIIGHICHMFSRDENIALFKKVQQALDPQGALAMIDFIPDDERSTRLFPLLFAVNMLINTEAGDAYTFSEYKEMLSHAGFREFSQVHLNDGQGGDVIVATL
jgi:hypothetical protein